MSDWQEMERTAGDMQERFEKVRRRLSYSECEKMEREIRLVREIADRERDSYVRWLWGR